VCLSRPVSKDRKNAVDLGIADRAGSITPGKRADLVLVRTSDTNIAPAGDPYEAIVWLAMPANVDTVIIDGRVLRRGGSGGGQRRAWLSAGANSVAPIADMQPIIYVLKFYFEK
jgi:N-acyl-D-aspartate/D-glutamate deacylase